MVKQLTIFVAAILLLAQAATGQSYIDKDSTAQHPKFYVTSGIYFPNIITTLRLDSDVGLGTVIGLEDDFKLDSELSVFKIDGMMKVKKRSQFVLGFTSLVRSREFKIDEEVIFLEDTFKVNANANVNFDTYYYAFTWRYSFFHGPKFNAGLSLGARWVQFSAGLEASLNDESWSEKATFGAPALLFGAHASGYLSPRLLARYSIEYFQVSIAGFTAIVLENRATLEYFIHKNVGIGGAYSTNAYSVRDLEISSNVKGRVNFAFGGFNLFLTARF